MLSWKKIKKKQNKKRKEENKKKIQILLIVPLKLTCNQVGDLPVECSARVM